MDEKQWKGQCPYHSGVEAQQDENCRRCTALEEQKDKLWDEVSKKASLSSIKWGIGIGLIILMAILGSMWGVGGKLSGKIDSMNDSLIALKTKVDIYIKSNNPTQ